MRDLFPKQKTKFVDAVVGADRSMFGESSKSESAKQSSSLSPSSSSEAVSVEEEKDLDHEEDANILVRIEHELRKLEVEENLSDF